MVKREKALYIMTFISLLAVIVISFNVFSSSPNIADSKFMSLTGNAVVGLQDTFNQGDLLHGEITVDDSKQGVYGVVELSKEGQNIATKTFNLDEIPKKEINPGKVSIKIEDLINYTFEESGDYELFLSILDLDVNIKTDFTVE